MALNPDDQIPKDISLSEAYSAIRAWYQSHISEIQKDSSQYAIASVILIKVLPKETLLSELEMRAVLDEVIRGRLEWAYHRSDGKYKMAAYAHGALEAAGYRLFLSSQEQEQLRESRLWPYLTPSDYIAGVTKK